MEEAGLSVRLDAAGNLIGRYDGLRHEPPVLAIGSHLDTVPNAGKYDGVIGVLLGVAAVKALQGRKLPFGIDVIAFSEEEGVRYGTPFLGSRAAAGQFDCQLLDRTDRAGITMADAFRSFGLDPARVEEAAYPAGGLLGYLEVHIEQGPVLETLGAPAAVVGAIAGQSRIWAELRGRAGHAGTTPMELRQDALAAAAEVVLQVERVARSVEGVQATVGALTVLPGASNVIPGSARFSIDIRHEHDPVRMAAVNEIIDQARKIADQRRVEFFVSHQKHHAAVATDPAMTGLLEVALAVSRIYSATHRQRRRSRCGRNGGDCADGDALSPQSRRCKPPSGRTCVAPGRRRWPGSLDTLSRPSGQPQRNRRTLSICCWHRRSRMNGALRDHPQPRQRSHALIGPDSFVTSDLPGWERSQCIILISPRMGAVLAVPGFDGRGGFRRPGTPRC